MEAAVVGALFSMKDLLLGGNATSGAFIRLQLSDLLTSKNNKKKTEISCCHYYSAQHDPLQQQYPFLKLKNTAAPPSLLLHAPIRARRLLLLPVACLPAEVEVSSSTETIYTSTEDQITKSSAEDTVVEPSSEEKLSIEHSAEEEEEEDTVLKSSTQEAHQVSSTAAHVKFLLKKECSYGEQFLLVGDDPLLGEWNPTAALPLAWSEGHIWTTELDLPIDKLFKFKYLLKDAAGNIEWQPGPNREFHTWETQNHTITVSEEWEAPEEQKPTAEEKEEEEDQQQQEQPPPLAAAEAGTEAAVEEERGAEHAEEEEQKEKPDTTAAEEASPKEEEEEEEEAPVSDPDLAAESADPKPKGENNEGVADGGENKKPEI